MSCWFAISDLDCYIIPNTLFFSIDPSYKDFFAPPPRSSAPTPRSNKRSREISDPEAANNAASTSAAKKSKTDSELPKGAGEKKRGVSFNDSVRVKTIEARKNSAKERLELFKRLGMRGASVGDNDDDEDEEQDGDEDEEDVDWDMERFDNVDGVEDSFAVDDDDEDDYDEEDAEDDQDEDPDATESDPDLDGRDSDTGVGLETIQRLKNDLFDDDEPESGDQGTFNSCSTGSKLLVLI